MRCSGIIPVTALLAVLAGAMPGAPASHGDGTAPLQLTIAFTGDVSGYLEPCG